MSATGIPTNWPGHGLALGIKIPVERSAHRPAARNQPFTSAGAPLVEYGQSALIDAGYNSTVAAEYAPDTALVNYYKPGAKLGMHQDKDERVGQPVVSLSIGDTCRFRFGNTIHRGKPYTDIDLASGDAFVFGGPSRYAYHAVTKTVPSTGNPATGLSGGRINITMRVTGMS